MTSNKHHQQGFTLITAIVILTVCAVILAVGYYVWTKRSTATTYKNTTTSKAKSETANLERYTNSDLGFMLNYDKAWGKPAMSQQINQRAYVLSFKNDKSEAGPYVLSLVKPNIKGQMVDSPFVDVADYKITNGKVTVSYVDGSSDKDLKIEKRSDQAVLFSGGAFGKNVVGMKKVDYISGMPDAIVTVANETETTSPDVQKTLWSLLLSVNTNK